MNRSLVATLVLAVTVLAAPLATAAPRVPVSTPGSTATPMASWTHSGCWTRTTGGTCYDIYRDSSGQAWICKPCGTTKGPGPGKCSKISQAELDAGRWCS